MQRSVTTTLVPRMGLLALATSMAILSAACRPTSFHGTTYDPPEAAPSVVVSNAAGGQLSLADQKGSVVLLFFGYTHCPDVCPTTLSDWKRISTALGRDSSRVKFVFISVDPARDNPATLRQYVSRFDPRFIGATADSATLAHIEKSFHVTSAREAQDSTGGYAVTHSSQTFVIDKQGRLRLLYSFGMPTDDVVSDVRQLLRGA